MFHLNAYMATCHTRDELRQQTIASLSATDWKGKLTLEFNDPTRLYPLERHRELVRHILRRAAKEEQLFLILEDDLDFNRHLYYNLAAWAPVQNFVPGEHFFASLCNLGFPLLKSLPEFSYCEAVPDTAEGSQALLMSQATARYLVTCWGVEPNSRADLKILRLAARVGPLRYHQPSLVQHVGIDSLCGGLFREAADFAKDWKSPL